MILGISGLKRVLVVGFVEHRTRRRDRGCSCEMEERSAGDVDRQYFSGVDVLDDAMALGRPAVMTISPSSVTKSPADSVRPSSSVSGRAS
jgi:hypothetical protein